MAGQSSRRSLRTGKWRRRAAADHPDGTCSGRWPSVTLTVCSEPLRRTVTSTWSPGFLSAIACATSSGVGDVGAVDLGDHVAGWQRRRARRARRPSRRRSGRPGRSGPASSAGRGRRAWARCRSRGPGSTCLTVLTGIANAMPTLPSPPPARGDLRVDADHLALGVEQRAARVAGVDRRVGLDDLVDREAVGRLDLALEAGHDARGRRAVEAERVADRDHAVADLRLVGVGELERADAAGVARVDLDGGEVGRGVDAEHLGVVVVALVVEAHLHLLLSPTTCALVTIVPLLSTRKPVPEPLPVRIDATLGLAAA